MKTTSKDDIKKKSEDDLKNEDSLKNSTNVTTPSQHPLLRRCCDICPPDKCLPPNICPQTFVPLDKCPPGQVSP